MDQEPTMRIKKEETDEVQTELCFTGQVYPSNMNLKEELQDSAIKEFLVDPLKTEGCSVWLKQDPELKHADGPEHNVFQSVEDPLEISWFTDFIKEDPELNLEMNVTENIVETSTRYGSDSARLTQSTGGSCGVLCEENCHHRLVNDELVIDMEKSTHEFGTDAEDGVIHEECSVATQYDCSMRKKELHVYSCNFCQQSFPSKYRLIMHVFMHIDGTQPPSYVCEWCGEVFHSNVSLKKHLRMGENYQNLTVGNHGKYGFSDEHQSIIFLDSEPEVSVAERNEQSSYEETRKASKKSSNDMSNVHMRNDAEKTSHYGTLSTAVNISAQANLLTAKRTDKCGICGKLFARSGDLKRHVFIHTGKKPHKCDICGKSFALSSSLNKHLLIHTGKKPHKCEICDKSFAHSSNLKTHILIHTGKKPHNCEICGKSFAFSSHLNKHVLIHSGKKPHKCENCDKSFTQSCHLKRHLLIHTGMKPHKCEICGKAFARSWNLKTHIHTHRRKVTHM
ncbi:zinc finger protein 99-like isoform X2 [Schistocerca cancellata]|nr:zinc finger protein 99-like isoform X2 [Schistocerca cancellata]